jgi:serine/threonine protein phosphatase PrpC
VRCFIGKKKRNEDYGAITSVDVGGVQYRVILISDGVSTAERGHKASESACKAGRDAILAKLTGGETDLRLCLQAGVEAAQEAVLAVPCVGEEDECGQDKSSPAATFIAGIVSGAMVEIVNVGDCRAYLLAKNGGAKLLTKDDSWINRAVDSGEMTLSAAMKHKRSHEITRWLGPARGPLEASYWQVDVSNGKMLIFCSDGFWNYAHPRQDEPPANLLEQVLSLPKDSSAPVLANQLVDFANDAGGHDNITVAVLKL